MLKKLLRNNKLLLTIFFVLILLAINLGGLLFYLNINKSDAPITSSPLEKEEGVGPETSKIELLAQLPANASSQEKAEQGELLKKNARETAIVFVNKECDLSPTVAKVKANETFKLLSEVDNPQTITLNNKTYTLEKNTPMLVDLNGLPKGELLPLLCNKENLPSGYILIN